MRPPPGAGLAHTGSFCFSASSTASSHAPEASTSGPATSPGLRAVSSAAAMSVMDPSVAVATPGTVRGGRDAGDRARGRVADGVDVDLDYPVVHRDRHECRALRRQRRGVYRPG